MAQRKKPATRSDSSTSHQDRDTLTSSAVADPHSTAFAERQKDPNRYEDPTVATPGQLDDIDEETANGPQALIDPDVPEINLDPSVDNRDQVQPMLDTLAESIQEDPMTQAGVATAAINAHESDAIDVEAAMEEQEAKREEARKATAESREENRSTATEPRTSASTPTPSSTTKK